MVKAIIRRYIPYIKYFLFFLLISLFIIMMLMEPSSEGLSFLRFVFSFFIILFVPGCLLFLLFYDTDEFELFEIIPISFFFSLGIMSVLGFLIYVLRYDVTLLKPLTPILITVLFIVRISLKREPRRIESVLKKTSVEIKNSYFNMVIPNLLIWAILICISIVMFYEGAYFHVLADSMHHVGTIRQIVETHNVFPTNAFYEGVDDSVVDPRKGLYHTTIALVALASKVDPVQIWMWLPVLLAPISILTFFSTAKTLLKDRDYAIISTLLFIILTGIKGFTLVGTSNPISFQIYLITLLFVFKYLRIGDRKYLLASLFLGITGVLVHVIYFIFIIVALSSFYMILLIWKRDGRIKSKRIFLSILLLLVVSAPILFFRYKISYAIANPVVSVRDGISLYGDTIIFGKNIFISNPNSLLDSMKLFAYVLLPFLFKYAKKNEGIKFIIANMILPPLLVFNPVLTPILVKYMSFLARRTFELVPYIFLIGFFLKKMLFSMSMRNLKQTKLKPVIWLVVFLLLLIPYINKAFAGLRSPPTLLEKQRDPFQWQDAMEFIENKIDTASVILSDQNTSYSIPAFTKHYVVAVQDPSQNVPNNLQRQWDVQEVLSPHVDLKETIEILLKYNVDYILLNHTLSIPEYHARLSIVPEHFPDIQSKFDSNPGLFDKIYEKDNVYIYKFNRFFNMAEIPENADILSSVVLEKKPDMQNEVYESFKNDLMLLGADIDETEAKKGQKIHITCYWTRLEERKESETFEFYSVPVRFNTHFRKNIFYKEVYSKLYRRMLEKYDGKRYRFRSGHNPTGGVYPVYKWNKGEIIKDEFYVTIPTDIALGNYEIKVKILSKVNRMNYRLRDFFNNNDIYEGASIGSINISE